MGGWAKEEEQSAFQKHARLRVARRAGMVALVFLTPITAKLVVHQGQNDKSIQND